MCLMMADFSQTHKVLAIFQEMIIAQSPSYEGGVGVRLRTVASWAPFSLLTVFAFAEFPAGTKHCSKSPISFLNPLSTLTSDFITNIPVASHKGSWMVNQDPNFIPLDGSQDLHAYHRGCCLSCWKYIARCVVMILSLVTCVLKGGRNNEINARGKARKTSGFQMSLSAMYIADIMCIALPIHICLDLPQYKVCISKISEYKEKKAYSQWIFVRSRRDSSP